MCWPTEANTFLDESEFQLLVDMHCPQGIFKPDNQHIIT
jgi:hypothetical protein